MELIGAGDQPARRRTGLVALVSVVLLAAGALILGLRYDFYLAQTTVMGPAVERGERVLVAPLADGAGLEAGQVVIVESGGWSDEPSGAEYILRVGAVGGDTVSCCGTQGEVLVNGAVRDAATVSGNAPGAPAFTVTVPKGRVFLLGDRRDIARDSRAHLGQAGGTVPLSAVKGRAVAKIVPPGAVPGIGSAVTVSANPLDSAGMYGYAAALLVLGAIGLLYALVRVLLALSRRRGRAAAGVS
jgi:signal peptidase I